MTLPTDITVGDPDHAGMHNAERSAINNKPDDFVELGDTPASLAGQAGKAVAVNAAADALELVVPELRAPNVETASYTLILADARKAVEMDVASANTVTVPPNSSVAFPVGTVVEVVQVGAGQVEIVPEGGVTIRTPETLLLRAQWSTVSLRKRAADEWVLTGDVEAL